MTQLEDQSTYQNRRGPGGIALTPRQAVTYFPLLGNSPSPFEGTPPAGCSVLVAYEHLRLWLHNVEIGVEAWVYFGTVAENVTYRSETTFSKGQVIGFGLEHIFDVAKGRSK